MILGFKRVFDGKAKEPTNFKDKILRSFDLGGVPGFANIYLPKLHTIRLDKHARWKEGMKIHFAYGVRARRKEDYDNFHTAVCTGTQKVEIFRKHITASGKVYRVSNIVDAHEWNSAHDFIIHVDGWQLPDSDVKEFCQNDGFDDVKHFCTWFKEDFVGVLIHWTPVRYKPITKVIPDVDSINVGMKIAIDNRILTIDRIDHLFEDKMYSRLHFNDIEWYTIMHFDEKLVYKNPIYQVL